MQAVFAIIAIASAVVVAIGSVLDWITVDTGSFGDDFGVEFDDVNKSGLDADGSITIVLAIGIAIVAILALTLKRAWTMITGIVVFALIALIALIDIGDVSSRSDDLQSFGLEASVGVGLWLVLLGGIVGTIACIIGLVKRLEALQ